MKVEHHTQWAASTITFSDSDDVYLRLAASAVNHLPIWYILDEGSFEWVQDSSELDLAFTDR